MKIGEVSKIVGLSTSAIRFYERHGLLGPGRVSRAGNGYRVYSPQDLEEIQLIVKFKELGLELDEIKNLLSEEPKSCTDLVSSLEAQIVKYRKIEDLAKNRIGLLVTAKTQCELRCKPDNNVKKCFN